MVSTDFRIRMGQGILWADVVALTVLGVCALSTGVGAKILAAPFAFLLIAAAIVGLLLRVPQDSLSREMSDFQRIKRVAALVTVVGLTALLSSLTLFLLGSEAPIRLTTMILFLAVIIDACVAVGSWRRKRRLD